MNILNVVERRKKKLFLFLCFLLSGISISLAKDAMWEQPKSAESQTWINQPELIQKETHRSVFSDSPDNSENNPPVLRGPGGGGDPIGGVPVQEGMWIIVLCASVYLLVKHTGRYYFNRKKMKRNKTKQSVLGSKTVSVWMAFMLCCTGFNLSAQTEPAWTHVYLTSAQATVSNLNSLISGASGNLRCYHLPNDIVAPASGTATITIPSNRTVKLVTASGSPRTYKIDANSRGRVIDNSGTLWLEDIIITGGRINTGTGTARNGAGINSAGTLILLNGTQVINNTSVGATNADANGGGIYANELTLKGNITITGNEAGGNGGGIYKSATGAFNVSNLTSLNVSYNTSKFTTTGSTTGGGGGIYTAATLTFAPQNNVTITGNISNNGGGGVNVHHSSFTIHGGEISNNKDFGTTAASGGGGVYGNSSTITISGTLISGNKTDNNGGGIYGNRATGLSSSNVVITDAKIINNTATKAGGGIAVNASLLTISGNTLIEKNEAISNGGGIYGVSSGGDPSYLTISGAKIIENKTSGGGGISLNGSHLTVSDSVLIKKNTTTARGGGIGANNTSTIKISGGEIIENKTDGEGGGISIMGTSTLTMSGSALIENNTAGTLGGGIYNRQSSLIFKDTVTITHNTAYISGGGIYLTADAVLFDASALKSLLMSSNTAQGTGATDGGGGIYSNIPITFPSGSSLNFTQNQTAKDGGGIYINATLSIKSTSAQFTNNKATNEGGGIFIANVVGGNAPYAAFNIVNNVVFSGNTANNPYWLENENPATNTYRNPHTVSQIMGWHNPTGNIKTTAPYSAPPAGNKPFTYLINNYDVNFVGVKTSNINPIEAVNDAAITKPGKPVNIPVLDNDIYTGTVDVTAIGTPKNGGTTNLNDDGTITYTPKDDTWEGIDEFDYEICYRGTENCSSAKVYVLVMEDDYITCDESKDIQVSIPDVTYTWYNAQTEGSVIPDSNPVLIVNRNDVDHFVDNQWVFIDYRPNGESSSVFKNRVQVRVRFVPHLMYWKRNPVNNDWNNAANWEDENETAFDPSLDLVPWPCTVVHIPGNANKYPSLESPTTNRTVYNGRTDNEPTCDIIYYHFGGEVAKPHYLKYNRAYVHYNFGKYPTDTEGGTLMNGDLKYSADNMIRERWYAVAAPLKKIVTGDFSVGGYPSMWQQGFKTSRDRNGDLFGDWYIPENTMAMEIGTRQNYAISLYSSQYLAGSLGEDDHKHLNSLNGIFEIPYFETDLSLDTEHRLHIYNPATKTSKFYYYYWQIQGLPICDTCTPDEFKRGEEAYRFVFEDNNNNPIADFKMNLPVNEDEGQVSDVMVGNPFISSFDFAAFHAANSDKIEDYYRLYEDGGFTTYRIGDSDFPLIAPLQAFFVTPKGTSESNVELSFKENFSVLRAGSHQLKSSVQDTGNSLKVEVRNNLGSNRITLSLDKNTEENIVQMFSNDKDTIPQIYVLDGFNVKNAYQYVTNDEKEIVSLGIVCKAKGDYSLSFTGAASLPVESLVLKDKELGVEYNLLENDTYNFRNTSNNLTDRFELHFGKRLSAGMDDMKTGLTKIYTLKDVLYVESDVNISEVKLFNIQGMEILSDSGIDNNLYMKRLELQAGIYIVKVKLASMEVKTEKVFIK